MSKEKPCKGINRAKDYEGCGQLTTYRENGLCPECLKTWSKTTAEGWAWVQSKVIPKAKKEVRRKKKKQEKKLRWELEPKSALEKKLQKEINAIVRLIDRGHPCISSGRPLGKNFDAGHLFSVGSNPQIRFHLFNIWAQSVEQNQHKGGNPLGFIEGIENTFGSDLKDFCLSLKGLPSLHLNKSEIQAKIDIARSIRRHLELENKIYTNTERIELRKKFNAMLGIYPNKE